MPIKSTGGAANVIYEEISSNQMTEEVSYALSQSNQEADGEVLLSVENILKAINLLNREEK